MFPPAFLQDAPPKLVIGKIQNELKMGTSSFCINRSLAEQQQKTVPNTQRNTTSLDFLFWLPFLRKH